MSDPTVRNADAMAREAIAALLPFTSHSIGCAIYQRSWASGEPPCTCGLDDARALAALSPADGDAGVEDDWLVAQLAAWPTRVDREKTTNIEYLMKAAARRIRALTPTETGEQGK